jgi:outer membrane protein OmpA-like peptidoglycan-associated protein
MNSFKQKIMGSILTLVALVLVINITSAQEKSFRDQAWRYGLNLGLNYNSASLGYQHLHEPFPNFDKPNTDTEDNINGTGWAGYGGAFVEYLSSSWWGVQLRVSYDMRDALVTDSYATPNTEFDTRMSYIAFEPALRIDQHLIPNLSITAGPLIAANIHGTYDYKADANGPLTDEGLKVPDRSVASLGVTGGAAYDIEISRSGNNSVYLSPFFDYSWIAAQRKSVVTRAQNSSNDIWSTQTFRFGLRLSFESRKTPVRAMTEVPQPVKQRIVEAPAVNQVVMVAPRNNEILTKDVTGYFPILPYVFFDEGSQNIPDRYVLFANGDAREFKESDLQNFSKNELTTKETNIDQLMLTYHNVLNIYADRMRTHPNEKLILRGSDPQEQDGKALAYKVKNYMVEKFKIDPSRITVEEQAPRKPSGSDLTDPAFSRLIDDENRRVEFVFSNPDMYLPVAYTTRDESSIYNDMVFSVAPNVPLKNWSIRISSRGQTVGYGPFTSHTARINPAPMMRGLNEEQFKATALLTLSDGKTITETFDFKLSKNKEVKIATRYLMIFDYNKSDAIASYEKKIRREITPGMLAGNQVIVHGHTDIIGNEEANQKLSQERSDEAKGIIDDELGKNNRTVDVQAIGVGQTQMPYTFENSMPEGRMYNRNVFVEIIR